MNERPHAFQVASPLAPLENPVRQIGWLGHSGEGRFYRLDEGDKIDEPGGFSPVYIEVGD